MKKPLFLLTTLVFSSILFLTLTARAQESTEGKKIKAKNLYGKWKVTRADLLNAPSIEQMKAAAMPTDTSKAATQGKGARTADQVALRNRMNLENFMHNEAKSTMELFPNKTAIKIYNTKVFNLTWKLKGSVIVAKDVITKKKYRLRIVKWADGTIIVEQTTPAGDIRIVYEREK